jgi:N-acetylglucosaminyldiphosphoundecaprenol N-acetyl-beta-D-mannosaminyltransferase
MSPIVFPRVTLFGVPMARLSMLETLLSMEEAIDDEVQISHTIVNPSMIVEMGSNVALRNAVLQSDLITTNSKLLVWASRLLGKPLPEAVDTVHLLNNIARLSRQGHYRIFFFGLTEGELEKCVDNFISKYSGSILAGAHCGEYVLDDERSIAEQIADSEAQILFIDLPSPRQENFLRKYGSILSRVNVIVKANKGLSVISAQNKKRKNVDTNRVKLGVMESLNKAFTSMNHALLSTLKFLAITVTEGFKPRRYNPPRRGRLA